MAEALQTPRSSGRLAYLDIVKGISILWIVFFHFFTTYTNGRFPWSLKTGYFARFIEQCAPCSIMSALGCFGESIFVATSQFGFHAVGVFLVLSGFGLTYSLARTGDPGGGWRQWYFKRFVRLYPMYWVAHLIYLVSPFVSRPEAVDYRFFLSLLGDRIYPVEMIFYYVNPAWWYFGLLLQLYLVFPILFRALQKLGPLMFLVVCAAITLSSRYILLNTLQAHGYWVQGAFFGARLWEFAFGMVLAVFSRQRAGMVEERLFSRLSLLVGGIVYTLGLYSYASNFSYIFTDALTGTGLFIILAHLARLYMLVPFVGSTLLYVGAYSYGLYLLHQPYVIYFGIRMRDLSMPVFVVLACVVIAVLTAGSIPLERYVNGLTSKVLDLRKPPPAVVPPAGKPG